MSLDLKRSLFYEPEDVAALFGKSLRWVYRHAVPGGFLAPAARRFGKTLLFLRTGIDALTQ